MSYYLQEPFACSLYTRSFITKSISTPPKTVNNSFMGLAYQGKDIIVFRFIMEYSSSLRDFDP
jgi:hypothetical protein